MLAEFQKHLNQKFPLLKDKKLLLAVSGGVDSMVLLDLFSRLDYNIAVAHCNFNLRGNESDLDEKLVDEYCLKNQIKFYGSSFDTKSYAMLHKQSIQIAARELRYNWFDELIENYKIDYLLTAHHLDDSVETFLINFIRGTGIDGLLGIPETNDKTIRPLLTFSREDIVNYANKNNILWREDASNATTKYLRNKIRHDIVPVFKEKNPDFLKSFQQTVNNLSDVKALMEDASEIIKNEVSVVSEYELKIDVSKLKLNRNYKAYLHSWLKDYGFRAWNDIYDLVDARSGKIIYSENYILLKDRDYLILDQKKDKEIQEYYIFKENKLISYPISVIFGTFETESLNSNNKNLIFIDEDKLVFPLKLRRKQEGDFFFPYGMKGKKKVSKFFKDEKFSKFEKENTWILENGNKDIIWIIGHRMDERFKITELTKNKLQIKLSQ
nr:tRNA lysidine(34) synthetase TilS [uncultured Flavobacterium sp.]